MKKKILSLILVLATSLSVSVPAFAEEVKTETNQPTSEVIIMTTSGTINASNVRLRASAGLSGTVLALLQKGTQVEVGSQFKTVDGYLWRGVIVVGTGQTGWVADMYIDQPPV